MIKINRSIRSQPVRFLTHGRKSISLDRVPLTLAPFYRHLLLEMQTCHSDPALPLLSCTSNLSAGLKTPTPAISSSHQLPDHVPAGCLPVAAATKALRQAVVKRNAIRAERQWTEQNFPRQSRPGPFTGCVTPLISEEAEEAAGKVVGRRVAPQQFILSFHRTKGKMGHVKKCG